MSTPDLNPSTEPLIQLDLPHLESLCISQDYFFGQGGNQEDLHLPESVSFIRSLFQPLRQTSEILYCFWVLVQVRILDIVYSISEHSLSNLKSFIQNGTLPKALKIIRVDKAFFETPTNESDSESEYSQDEDGNQVKIVFKRDIEVLKEISEKKGLGLGRSKIDNNI